MGTGTLSGYPKTEEETWGQVPCLAIPKLHYAKGFIALHNICTILVRGSCFGCFVFFSNKAPLKIPALQYKNNSTATVQFPKQPLNLLELCSSARASRSSQKCF